MIRNEKEYKEAIRRLEQDKVVIQKQEEEFKKHNLSKEEIKRALDPMHSFHQQLAEEVEWYESVKRKHFGIISNLMIIETIKKRYLSMDECSQYIGITKGTLYVWVYQKNSLT